MTRLTRAVLFSLLLIPAACTDPNAPAADLRHQMGAVVTSGTGVFTFAGNVFFDCVGEMVHATVNAPYDYHITSTPGGNEISVERWRTEEVTGTMTGLSSGHVWTRANNRSPFVIHTSQNGTTMHYVFMGEWLSDTAPDLRIHERFFVQINADGSVKKQTFEQKCE